MLELSHRLDGFQESTIRKMTRISNQYGAINLSQGFPDFAPPPEILEELQRAAIEGPHQYAITWGAQDFREALAEKQERFMGLKLDPNENIVVTCGSTEAMMTAMMSICERGDKVAIFSPFYENYAADTILCGAQPIYIPLKPPTFDFDREALEDAFKAGAKALVLCNPSNPIGKVFTREELLDIAKIVEKYDAYVITDEVYEHIVYAPHKHTYFASLPEMFERTISCSSLSKTYSITGWRLGYVIAPKEIINQCKKVHDFLTVGAAAPLQRAAIVGLKFGDDYYNELTRMYTEKRELFLNGLDQIGLRYFKPEGAYYVMVDISEFGIASDNEFAEKLIKEVGVAGVPGSSFFKEDVNQYIRLHYAKKPQTLEKALEKLQHIRKHF
ncbi:pyridoxal phosphate-dependent aminotransferase [Cellulosilyticum ruminicola]|uniref:pyridoxal phosphate-dependent aminotransferase n=1 Tax=Cellulosilyticum ruminicola TaxID=425254 RepID=UPI0006D1D121|nr:pyridoxal phosphate-dependent aminotransferase [Cellulosilyticum ruminicola]